jgi:DNA-binding protein YbaB
LSNDSARHELTEVLALVQQQLDDIAVMRKKQAELRANGTAADGAVEVTVDASGHVVNTVIDESYLDDHEFEELAGFITEAAQAAAAEARRRVAEMMAPISERRQRLPSLSQIVEGAPDLRDLMPAVLDPAAVAQARPYGEDEQGWDETGFPTVKK